MATNSEHGALLLRWPVAYPHRRWMLLGAVGECLVMLAIALALVLPNHQELVPAVLVGGVSVMLFMVAVMLVFTRPRQVVLYEDGIANGSDFTSWSRAAPISIDDEGLFSFVQRRDVELWGMDGTLVEIPFPPNLAYTVRLIVSERAAGAYVG